MAGGRPRNETATRRGCVVSVRLSEAERATLDARAAGAGLALPDFARTQLVRSEAPRRRGRVAAADRAANAAAVSEVNRIGVNLNQLVRGHHYGSGDPMRDDLAATLAEVRAWLERNV